MQLKMTRSAFAAMHELAYQFSHEATGATRDGGWVSLRMAELPTQSQLRRPLVEAPDFQMDPEFAAMAGLKVLGFEKHVEGFHDLETWRKDWTIEAANVLTDGGPLTTATFNPRMSGHVVDERLIGLTFYIDNGALCCTSIWGWTNLFEHTPLDLWLVGLTAWDVCLRYNHQKDEENKIKLGYHTTIYNTVAVSEAEWENYPIPLEQLQYGYCPDLEEETINPATISYIEGRERMHLSLKAAMTGAQAMGPVWRIR